MKKTLLTLTAILASMSAFAQGKLGFFTDSLHLVYYNDDPAYLSGQMSSNAVSAGNMPAGVTLVVDLYGGTSSSSLSLVSSQTFGTVAGRWNGSSTTFSSPALPASQAAFFQIQVRDNAHASATDAQLDAVSGWWGFSDLFTAVPQPASFNPIYQHTSPVNSTWSDGTFNMDNVGVGFRGDIGVTGPVVPEPTSLALVGLGVAGMLVFRRRNK